MGFINYPIPTPIFPVLPPLAWSVHKKPIMSSRVVIGATGRESQVACAVYPRWAFTLTYGGDSWLRDQTQNIVPYKPLAGRTELEQISGLFLSCLGPYGEFYYDDPDDDSRLNQFVGVGNFDVTTYPLLVNFGTGPFTPRFTYPVGGIKTLDAVYDNGIPINPSHYELDSTRTQLVFTFSPPPGPTDTITADFSFYFRCRFLDDHLTFSQWAKNLWENKEVRFESVKP